MKRILVFALFVSLRGISSIGWRKNKLCESFLVGSQEGMIGHWQRSNCSNRSTSITIEPELPAGKLLKNCGSAAG